MILFVKSPLIAKAVAVDYGSSAETQPFEVQLRPQRLLVKNIRSSRGLASLQFPKTLRMVAAHGLFYDFDCDGGNLHLCGTGSEDP